MGVLDTGQSESLPSRFAAYLIERKLLEMGRMYSLRP